MNAKRNLKLPITTIESRNDLLSDFGKSMLSDRYLLPQEGCQDLFARVASYYADQEDIAHAQRLYDYMSKLWFMPATPILSNGGTNRGLPISCFINEINDSLKGIADIWMENVWLAARGGGIGSYWGNVRSINEKVNANGRTSGIVPFLKVQDSMTLAISQGSLRRGSAAVYLPIDHPEIEEFILLRKPTGGDTNRKTLNLHHGVTISDKFMEAVEKGESWDLISPHDGTIITSIDARNLWAKLLTTRVETGEPYILYTDTINRSLPEHQKKLGLKVKTSNLCNEITLPTGTDHLGQERTAVCCLSSLNLEYYDDWKNDANFIPDVMRFLDNVLEDFIQKAPIEMKNAKYSAMRERSVGLGVMGYHSFLQSKNVPIESVMAKVWNKQIFSHIKTQTDKASIDLGVEKGPCLDAAEVGSLERFSNKTAIAPTASISVICGGASPGIEPVAANCYLHKTLAGSFSVKNKHLINLLEQKGFNTEAIWSSITTNEGSVQHLHCLTDHEKAVYKTAYELDQNWIIELAAERAEFITQSQSLNIFLPGDCSKQYLHDVHFKGWKKGIKGNYYVRSTSLQRADKVSHKRTTDDLLATTEVTSKTVPIPLASHAITKNNKKLDDVGTVNYDECLACE